jgi:hypothetical protein
MVWIHVRPDPDLQHCLVGNSRRCINKIIQNSNYRWGRQETYILYTVVQNNLQIVHFRRRTRERLYLCKAVLRHSNRDCYKKIFYESMHYRLVLVGLLHHTFKLAYNNKAIKKYSATLWPTSLYIPMPFSFNHLYLDGRYLSITGNFNIHIFQLQFFTLEGEAHFTILRCLNA